MDERLEFLFPHDIRLSMPYAGLPTSHLTQHAPTLEQCGLQPISVRLLRHNADALDKE